jgi:glucokinase
MSLDPDGEPDITSAPGSLEDAIGDCTIKARSAGRFASTRELVNACSRRDQFAAEIWLTSVRALAAGLSSLINALDPELIVLGGGITRAGPALFQPLRRLLAQFEWRPGGHRVKIVPARLGDRAGAFGAAWNVLRKDPL